MCLFVSTRLVNRAGERAYLSKAVHSSVIADPNNPLASIETVIVIRSTSWIVNDHGRGTALDYVYWDIVSSGKCQDLWLPTPDPGITDGGAVDFELFRGHKTSICGADPVFTVY